LYRLVVGSHPQGELNHRTLEKHLASENCVHFFLERYRHGNSLPLGLVNAWQASGCVSVCGLSSSIGRMSASPATTKEGAMQDIWARIAAV
jgi:hypothetical protein